MSEDKKGQVDAETILITLDQIEQTIDIMNNVVGRLRGYITEQSIQQEQTAKRPVLTAEERNSSQTLH